MQCNSAFPFRKITSDKVLLYVNKTREQTKKQANSKDGDGHLLLQSVIGNLFLGSGLLTSLLRASRLLRRIVIIIFIVEAV